MNRSLLSLKNNALKPRNKNMKKFPHVKCKSNQINEGRTDHVLLKNQRLKTCLFVVRVGMLLRYRNCESMHQSNFMRSHLTINQYQYDSKCWKMVGKFYCKWKCLLWIYDEDWLSVYTTFKEFKTIIFGDSHTTQVFLNGWDWSEIHL